MSEAWKLEGRIEKSDEDKRLVFGWLSVAQTADGTPVVDRQGHVIDIEELEKAAYAFTLDSRVAGEAHRKISGIGRLVESVVLTAEKLAAMNITQPVQLGWWVGFKIDDEEVWAKIKSGEYSAFSIGGTGELIDEEN